MKNSRNAWCKFKDELKISDITSEFLQRFEKSKIDILKVSTINSYHRDLRAVINFFQLREKLIPQSFTNPYGRGGHTLRSTNPKKSVLSNEEILKVLSYEDFDNAEQRYARNIWATLYYLNGSNFVDLLRLRWDNRKRDYFVFYRKKTETTCKNQITPICVPVIDELQELLDAIGEPDSPFVLGELKEGYTENTFENKNHKLRQKINRQLAVMHSSV